MSSFCSRFDPLYCQEHNLEEEETEQYYALPQETEEQEEEEEHWTEAISYLLSRELETHPLLPASAVDSGDGDDTYLGPPRKSAVEWVVKISASHGFAAQTAMLAINYLDRCFLAPAAALRLQEDKPWMGRLAAAACLSLAAKVEETCVPLLLNLQLPQPPPLPAMEEMGYVFQGRTVRRMELLVLSSLGWRMNPVTPLSLVHRLLPKLSATRGRRREIFALCETYLLAVVVDWRWVLYPPSVWASAALLHAKERQEESFDSSIAASPAMYHSFHLLGVTKEAVEGGYLLIRELAACRGGGGRTINGIGYKRKHLDDTLHDIFHSSPPSPIGVIDSCFSCEGSLSGGESWAMWPLPAASSSEPPAFKKSNLNPIKDNSESKDLVVKN